jgi:hypothetical protein
VTWSDLVGLCGAMRGLAGLKFTKIALGFSLNNNNKNKNKAKCISCEALL